MDKGTRVKITAGDGEGIAGTVFWTGKDRYRDGLRLGLRGDDGETYWVSELDVEASDAPLPTGDTFDKGDRVRFRNRGEEGFGTVFWIGESRNGPGQRLGIRDDANPDDAVWLDARFAEPLAEGEGPPAPESAPTRPQRSAPQSEYDDSAMPADYAAPVSGNEMPAAPPMDDSWIDQMAQHIDSDAEDDMPF